MTLRMKRLEDGVVLTCLRAGMPPAIQRSRYGGFFAMHDLLHYAVETTMGFERAFLGLLAEGWSFETFGNRDDARYQTLPDEAVLVEHVVDVLSRRLAEGARHDPELEVLWADEVNAELATVLAAAKRSAFRFSAGQLSAIGRCFDGLAQRWAEVPVGGHMELVFPPHAGA